MDALAYQLLMDQTWALRRLNGAHEETDELLRQSIISAFEVIESQQEVLTEGDWGKLLRILAELEDIMPDDQFERWSIALSKFPEKSGRVHLDLRPFLEEIRKHAT